MFELHMQLGLLNLWICTAMIFLLPEVINRVTGNRWRRACRLPKMSAWEKVPYFIWLGVNLAICVYSVFVPVAFESAWFVFGVCLFVASMIVLGLGTYAYQTTPEDQLITKGIYGFSRNPGYFGTFCAYVGMGLIGNSGLILCLAVAHFLLYQATVQYEERMCNELYPRAFPAYKKRVSKNCLFF